MMHYTDNAFGMVLSISPGQKLCHVLFTHPTKHFKLLQVADMSLLILPKGDALNDCRPFQFQN